MSGDSAFTGSIPETYETCLVPALFAPYARDLAGRIAGLAAADILELAAGTGAVTREIARLLQPGQRLTATDLNQAMLDVAAGRLSHPAVAYLAADAGVLPFGDASFDAIAAQFGVMFFPDRPTAYAEARRILRPGGCYVFNVWGRLEDNPASLAVHEAAVAHAKDPPPDFIARVPFGYHDQARIAEELGSAGFTGIVIERLDFEQPHEVLPGLVMGMCRGSPLANALSQQPREIVDAIEADALDRVSRLCARGPVTMSALVVTARK